MNYYYLHHLLRLIARIDNGFGLLPSPSFQRAFSYLPRRLSLQIDRADGGPIAGPIYLFHLLAKSCTAFLKLDASHNVCEHDPALINNPDFRFGLRMAIINMNRVFYSRKYPPENFEISSHFLWPIQKEDFDFESRDENKVLENLESVFPVVNLNNRFWYLNDSNLIAAEESISRAELADAIISCNQKSVHLLRMHLNAGFKLISDYGIEF